MKKVVIVLGCSMLLVGAGCEKQPAQIEPAQPVVEAPTSTTWLHPKFGFRITIPAGMLVVMSQNGSDAQFIDGKGVKVGTMVIQPGIPGIPLPDNKIEKIKLDGIAAHLYHDASLKDGTKVDKIIADFPQGNNVVFIAAPELEDGSFLNLKAIAASWKWKK